MPSARNDRTSCCRQHSRKVSWEEVLFLLNGEEGPRCELCCFPAVILSLGGERARRKVSERTALQTMCPVLPASLSHHPDSLVPSTWGKGEGAGPRPRALTGRGGCCAAVRVWREGRTLPATHLVVSWGWDRDCYPLRARLLPAESRALVLKVVTYPSSFFGIITLPFS